MFHILVANFLGWDASEATQVILCTTADTSLDIFLVQIIQHIQSKRPCDRAYEKDRHTLINPPLPDGTVDTDIPPGNIFHSQQLPTSWWFYWLDYSEELGSPKLIQQYMANFLIGKSPNVSMDWKILENTW